MMLGLVSSSSSMRRRLTAEGVLEGRRMGAVRGPVNCGWFWKLGGGWEVLVRGSEAWAGIVEVTQSKRVEATVSVEARCVCRQARLDPADFPADLCAGLKDSKATSVKDQKLLKELPDYLVKLTRT